MMKLMIIIVRDSDDKSVVEQMVQQGYRVTRMSSTGGFLRRGNVTLLAGVDEEQVDKVISLLRNTCCPADNNHHRATVFVADMPYFAQV